MLLIPLVSPVFNGFAHFIGTERFEITFLLLLSTCRGRYIALRENLFLPGDFYIINLLLAKVHGMKVVQKYFYIISVILSKVHNHAISIKSHYFQYPTPKRTFLSKRFSIITEILSKVHGGIFFQKSFPIRIYIFFQVILSESGGTRKIKMLFRNALYRGQRGRGIPPPPSPHPPRKSNAHF